MPLTTKKILYEQVIFKLAGGYPDTNFPVQPEDIYKAIEQKVNATFKLRHFDTTMAAGESIPDNTMIGTYEGVTVTSLGNGKSKSLLPVVPISIPKNLGVFLVYDPQYPDVSFIPLQRGQTSLMRTDEILNDLFGQIAYSPKNSYIEYSFDLTQLGVNEVTMELCVMDMSLYSETDALPIPADMEAQIVNELVAEFSPVTAEAGTVNPWTTFGQNGKQ